MTNRMAEIYRTSFILLFCLCYFVPGVPCFPFKDFWICNPSCPNGLKCVLGNCVLNVTCPRAERYGTGPPSYCVPPKDPLDKPPSKLESWFTKDLFQDLFPKSNIGWGPSACFPYSFESFVIAARYFPNFGTEAPNNTLTPDQNHKRDVAAYFAHTIQETGENDVNLYDKMPTDQADACFYRGGLYNWFEGGPTSGDLPPNTPGYQPPDGTMCTQGGIYCSGGSPYNVVYPCNVARNGSYYLGCYFGRGPLQISYNYNYGRFQQWLHSQGINVDLLTDPNLIVTKTDPPLAMMASMWFYMTPQPPKPAMHDIILGEWDPEAKNVAAGYEGPIFGPTSLIINNECNGEDPDTPGGGGENRRIKAFRWFCSYFNVPTGPNNTLSCKHMVQKFDEMTDVHVSWQPDWSSTWKNQSCNCAPAYYGGLIPYYEPDRYPQKFVDQNDEYGQLCVYMIYKNPQLFQMINSTSICLNYPLTKYSTK